MVIQKTSSLHLLSVKEWNNQQKNGCCKDLRKIITLEANNQHKILKSLLAKKKYQRWNLLLNQMPKICHLYKIK